VPNSQVKDPNKLTVYGSSGTDDHACYHLAHFKCLKDFIDFEVNERFQHVASLKMFSDCKSQDEKGRLAWIRKFNAGKIDFDWEQFHKDYGYATCGVACQRQLRYIHEDDLRTYRSKPLWMEWELEEKMAKKHEERQIKLFYQGRRRPGTLSYFVFIHD
jgi:hypothetical protein